MRSVERTKVNVLESRVEVFEKFGMSVTSGMKRGIEEPERKGSWR